MFNVFHYNFFCFGSRKNSQKIIFNKIFITTFFYFILISLKTYNIINDNSFSDVLQIFLAFINTLTRALTLHSRITLYKLEGFDLLQSNNNVLSFQQFSFRFSLALCFPANLLISSLTVEMRRSRYMSALRIYLVASTMYLILEIIYNHYFTFFGATPWLYTIRPYGL